MPHLKDNLPFDADLAALIAAGKKPALRAYLNEYYSTRIHKAVLAAPKTMRNTCKCGKKPKCWVLTTSVRIPNDLDYERVTRLVGPYCSKCLNHEEYGGD